MHFSCAKSRRQLLQATHTRRQRTRGSDWEPCCCKRVQHFFCYVLKLVFSYIYLHLCILDYAVLTKEAFQFDFELLKPLNVNAAVVSVLWELDGILILIEEQRMTLKGFTQQMFSNMFSPYPQLVLVRVLWTPWSILAHLGTVTQIECCTSQRKPWAFSF